MNRNSSSYWSDQLKEYNGQNHQLSAGHWQHTSTIKFEETEEWKHSSNRKTQAKAVRDPKTRILLSQTPYVTKIHVVVYYRNSLTTLEIGTTFTIINSLSRIWRCARQICLWAESRFTDNFDLITAAIVRFHYTDLFTFF